ncbi:hypothetical protein K501DRAFT_315107 [Backusella circina FSU 941]|nr:hypothetical protein K501DRAFT_315107 [Backusella circina FSU 941]
MNSLKSIITRYEATNKDSYRDQDASTIKLVFGSIQTDQCLYCQVKLKKNPPIEMFEVDEFGDPKDVDAEGGSDYDRLLRKITRGYERIQIYENVLKREISSEDSEIELEIEVEVNSNAIDEFFQLQEENTKQSTDATS